MKRHASMNRIYRLVWSRVRNAWLVAAETSRGQGKGAGRKLTRAARALKAAAAGLVGQAFVAASGILLAVNSSAVIAQSIRADGRTQTVVTTSGPITNITTGTVSGVNAFNSFAVFNVGQGATANLFLPTGTVNLINLVRDERSMINGTLNSVMNGHIGGNVYFANPLGFVVGAQGVLNVGSLNVTTPTRSFVDNFFNAFGVPNAAATAQLLGGGAPIDPSGLISIRGRVNAVNGVSLRAGNVDVSGTLVTGARFAGSAPDFSDVVNVNGLNTGSQLIESGGRIMIVADNDVTVSGTIATPGGPGVRGGDISITAGGNVGIAAGANVSVRGNGENSAGGTINMYGSTAVFSAGARIDASAGSSGDGGAIEFSARDTVTLAGGEFAAGAANGRAGSVLVDPNNIELVGSNQIVSGANYSLVANNSIMVNSGVIISTRNIGASTDYDNAVSAGNSGDISLTAPSITLNTGSKLLAQVETGSLFQGGAVTLTATQTNGGIAQINLLQSTLSGKSVTLQASSILNDASPALLVLSGINTSAAAANILLDSSQVTAAGGALNISSLASVNVSATGPIPLAVLRSTSNATVDVKGSSSLTTTTGNASLGATSSVTSTATPTSPFAALAGDAMVATSDVTSTASVHLGDTASANIGGTLGLAATNTVTTTQVANAAASGASAAGAVVALSIMNNTTSATVDGQASIANAKALNLSALSTNTATVTAKAAAQGAQEDSSGTSKGSQTLASYKDDMKTGDSGSGGVKVAGAVAVSDLKNVTQAYLASSQQANIDGAATLTSRVTNSATVGADGSATSGSVGVGVAVAVNVAKSTNQSYIAQNVTAQSLALTAAMNPAATTGQFTTTAVSGAGASNVGAAGSIAVNVLDLSSTAAVNGGSLITIAGGGSGNVSLVAENLTASSASATPSGSGASGSSVGIGAAVAVNVVSNRAIAQLSDNAGLAGVTNTSLNDVTVMATGADTVTTQAEAGAAGGVAITPVAAINVINNTTTAQIGSNGTPLILGGSLLVAAEHSASTTASAKGSAKGSSAAVGAAVAVNLVNDTATATTSREVQAGANVTFNAHAASASSASAIASAAGGKSDDQKAGDDGDIDTKVDKQLQSGKDMQASNKVGDSSERANTQSQKSASASSSEGKISVAAAVAVNLQKSTARATVPDNGKITAGGALKVSSSNNTDGAALTDGSAVGSTAAVGIGAGISINLVKSVNEASIGQNALVSASGITLEALMKDVKGNGSDLVNTFNTEAKSGAGGSKVGLAGSLALNLIDTSSQALLKSGAQAHALGGNVSLTADDRTSTTGKALPADGGGASGGKVGIGASVAVNVVANRSTAEIQDTAKLDGARDLSLQANGQFDMLTQAEAGSQGGISITPSVAVSVVNNSTTARVGASATALTLTGDLLVQAQQTSSTSTLAKGSSQGAKAAIGAAVAVALVDDEVSATTAREINATGAAGAGKGNVSFLAHGDSASSASATASAVGGNTDDNAGKTDPNTGKKTEDASVDDKVKTQSDFGKKQQADNNVGDAKQKGSTTTAADGKPSASSSEGKISVAAAVAVNLQQSNVRATVPDSGKITAAGRLTLSSSNNTDGAALTDGSAVGSTTTLGIGAGISINLVKSVNEASIGQNAQVSSNGITLEALMKDVKGDGSDLVNTIDAEAKSGAGGTKVGLAGSLALNLIDTSSQALVKTGADLNAGAGSVSLTADDRTTVTGKALPADDSGATGGKVGIGVSVAVNIVANRATAEIQDTAKLATTGDLNLGATGKFAVNTEVEAGASGGVAITPAVALAIVNNTSIARLGSGLELTNPGAVTISVDHSSTTTTSAKGSAQGDKAAVGAAVGIVLLNDVAAASIERNIQTATGPVSISASANSASTNTATASAVGGKSTDDAGQTDPNTGKKSEDATVDDKVNNQTAYGKKSQTDNGVGNSSQQSATANADSSKTSASSDEGQVAVAAAVAVNIISAKATAKLADGVTVKTSGALAVNASGNTDSSTTSSGSAVGSTAKVGIGAAVSVNKVDSHNEASIGQNAQVVAQGVTVESKMTDVAGDTTNTFDAQAQSGAGGSKVGIAASLALNVIDTSGKALIKSGASIDAGGDLNMTAEDFSKTTGNAAPTTTGGATGGKVGIGASVALNLIDSAAQAQIGAGAGVSNAGSITITATTKADSDAEATAGATGGKLAFDAAVAVTTLNQTTDASIAWGSGISASGNVGLAAASSGTHTANTVGTAKSGSVAIGASVGVITSSSTTTATIDRNLGTSGSFSLAATADRSYEATAKASASGTQATDTYTNNQAQADKSASSSTLKNNQNSQTNQGTQGQGKVNVAAAVSVLVIGDDATASVTGGRTIQSGVGQAMSISATNNSNFSARGAGDAVDPASKVGVGIGVGIVIANNKTSAALANNTHVVQSGALSVLATSTQNTDTAFANKLTAEGIAGAGGSNVGVAGAFAVVDSNLITTAKIGDNTKIDQSGAIIIDAENTSTLSAKAWAGAFGNVGVGASVATVISNNQYTALLGGGTTDVTASSLSITARNNKFSPTPFTLTLGNIGDLSDEAGIKAEFTSITDQMKNGKLLGGGNYYTEAAAGAAGDKVAVAGSFAVNVFKDVTDASIGGGATINANSGMVAVTASNDTVARSLAGSASAGGSVGIGVSSADVASTNVTSSHIDAGARITQSGGIKVKASNTLDIEVIGIAAAASGTVAVGGVVNVITLNNSADAYIANSTATSLISAGTFELGATNTVTGLNIASGLSASGSVGVGIAAATNTIGTDSTHQFGTHAYIGDGATVNAGTTTLLNATASENLTTFAIAGAASGSVSVGGAAVVNVMNTDTKAYVGSGAKVNKAQALVSQSASLSASDTTSLFDVVVGVGLGGTVGVGASGDVGVLSKSTQAYIGNGAWLETAGNLQVQSAASEDFRSIAIGLGVGGTAGGAGSVSVYSLTTNTLAYVDDNATVRTRGNALITADDATVMNLISGSAAGGGTAAIGAAAGVTVFDKTTRAYIGANADVEVLGNGASGIAAATGDIGISFGSAIGGNGQVKSSGITPKDAQGNTVTSANGNSIGDRNAFQGLAKTRTATPATTSIRGLAVTATNRDKLESFSVTGAAGGAAAITLGGNVAVLTTDTEAEIRGGAKINQNGTPANAAQSVRVAAGSDQFHIGLAGAASGAGGAAVGAGADVIVASNTIKATIGKNAQVKAARDVEVLAHGQEQYLEMGAGLAAAGSLAIAGSVGVVSITDKTYATIEGGTAATTKVDAGGNVRVNAGDDTETNMISGAAAAGFGVAGLGVAVGVNIIEKETQATIGNGVSVNARGAAGAPALTAYLPDNPALPLNLRGDNNTTTMHGLQVQATSKEDLFVVSASGAAGLYAGVSGAVTVTTVKSNTAAAIGDSMKINLANSGAASDQDVNVTARNQLKTMAFTGSVAISGGVGLSGGVDVFTAKNNTSAKIGAGSEIHVLRDVAVNALATQTMTTTVVSAAGGALAGIAGGVSVYSVGDKLNADSQGQLTSSGDVKGEADSQAKDGSLNDSLLGSSTDANVKAVSTQAKTKRAAVSTDLATTGTPAAGNSATIGDNAKIYSGRNVAVNSRGSLNFTSTTGAAGVGALGLGFGIGISNFTLNNQATLGLGTEVTAGGDLIVRASLNENAQGLAFAGAAGIAAANAAWSSFSDNSTTIASVGSGSNVHAANHVVVEAKDVRTLDAQSIGASVGAFAVGASVATASVGGTTSAFIDSGSFIGAGTDVVGNLTVSADSRVKATSSTLAAAGGLGLAASGSAATATAAPTVTAYVDGGTIDLSGDAKVQAVGSAGASADAEGFNVSVGAAVGASIALANASPQVSAYLGNNTVLSANTLTVSASHLLPDFLYGFNSVLSRSQVTGVSVMANASGASGALLLGATATDSEADYGTAGRKASVTANVGNGSSLTVPGTLSVSAVNNSSQSATSSGLAIGIVAIGSNDSYARSNTITHADLGNTVHIDGGTTGASSITAQGADSNIAYSVSGSGGVIAGAAASANTVEISDTRASIGDSTCGAPTATCGILTGSLTLSGTHDSIYNGKVNSTQASVAGASGATNTHNVSSIVNVSVGAGVNVTAGHIAIAGNNATHKYWWGLHTDDNSVATADGASWNVDSGSGGLFNLPAGKTLTTINQRTNVSLGANSLFHVLLPTSGVGSFTLDANNVIVSYDKTKLDSGGAIALAESNTLVNAGSAGNPDDQAHPKVNAIVTLGANSTITSDSGDINIGSRTDAKIDIRAVANAYGLAGAPSGKAYINYFGTNSTTVGSGALLLASDADHGAINVAAGENSSQRASSIYAHSAVNLWNKTAIPINSTPDAQTNVAQNARVTMSTGSNTLAAGDIGLAAARGDIQVSAVGVGKDLYREVAAAIAGAIGIDASLDIKGGSAPTPGGIAQVTVDGKVLSGLLRQSATQIDPVVLSTNADGSVVWQIKYSQADSTLSINAGLADNPLDSSKANPYIGWLTGSSQSGRLAQGQIQESDVPPNSQLKARITLLQGLLAQYAADPVSSAAYQSEINFLTKKLGAQGVGQNSAQVTARGGAALDAAGAVDSALSTDQILITGDISGDTRAKQIGAVGGLIDAYISIDANNSTINSNLITMKNAPTTPALRAANATYASLTTNRTTAATSYQSVRTAATNIGNYSFVCDTSQAACAAGAPVNALGNVLSSTTQSGFRIVSGSGYLGNVQSDMQNISQLALKQGGTGTLVSNVTDLSNQMTSIKNANASIVTAAADVFSNLSQASTRQTTLSSSWHDTASSDNVDNARVAAVAGNIAANSPLIGGFNAATAGSNANIIQTNKVKIDTAAADALTAVGTVTAADNTPPVAGTQKLITFPDISVKLGNVNVKADVLAGSGELQAPGDGKIWITNNTPASMDIANLTVDATGGNVRLNGFLVNNATDVHRFNPAYQGAVPTIVSRENGLAGAPEIKIVSTYDPGAYLPGSPDPAKNIPAAAPDITLGYRVNTTDPDKVISNPIGLVSVTSAAGDIYVDGSITAGSVSILAKNGDFVQQFVNGFNSVAGEPNANVQGGNGVLPPGNTQQPGNGIVANGNIFISARYLNINGLVQSGIVNYHLDIPNDASLQFKLPNGTIVNKAYIDNVYKQQVDVVVGTSGANDQSAIGATYDPATQTIFMTSTAKVHGGNITLFGQIINTANGSSTGAGKLAVLDGFGQIAVNNASSLPVVLKTIDTGADPDPTHPGRGVVGVIDITDVQYVGAAGDQTLHAIHTVISRDQDAITVKQTGAWNTNGTFNPNSVITTFASDGSLGANPTLTQIQNSATIQNAASRVTSESARLGTYDPQAGLRYVYTTGTDTSTKYTWTFRGASFFGTSSLALPPDSVDKTLTSGPNVLSNYNLANGTYLSYVKPVGLTTAHSNNLVTDAAMASAGTSQSGYQRKPTSYQTSSVYKKVDEWNDCNWWTLCIASRYTSIWDQTTGTTTVTTNSVKADYPIQIQFMGVNTPSLTVNSANAGVSLAAGNQLNNRYGDTTISAKSFAAGSASLVNTRNLSITAGNGSIGSDAAPVNVLMSGTLTAAATAGNVEINQIAGSLKVATVSASGDPSAGAGKVVLITQGDLYGDANALISAPRIELTSATGAIGGITGNANANLPLAVAPGYTSDLSAQQYYGLKASASGDIGIDAKASAGNLAGQLLVDTVVSKGGDVRLTAPGQIIDNNPDFTIDTRTWNQLLNYWDSVALRAGADNTQKLAQSLNAYENSRTQNYSQYWQIRRQQNPPAVFDASWLYTASTAERNALKNDASAISQFETGRTEQYWALSKEIAGYDTNALARGLDASNLKKTNPTWTLAQIEARVLADEAAGTLPTVVTPGTQIAGFIFVAPQSERGAQATGSTWTTSQLALGLNPGLLKDVTDTNPVIKAPNASGRNVILVAGTSIGSTLPASNPAAVVIPLNTDGNLTDKQKVALATAEFSDFVFSDAHHQTGTLTISQRLPVNFSATTGLSASVRTGGVATNPLKPHVANTDIGNVYLASLGSGLINDVSADGEVRIKVKGPISALDTSRPAINAGDLILEAANGTIGGDVTGATPLLVNVHRDINATADSYGSLTARASGSINLVETGDMAIGGIFSRDAITVASTSGSILNARPLDNHGLVLLGGTVQMSAPLGSIGDIGADEPVAVGSIIGTQLTGMIQAQAGQAVYLKGPSNPLVASNFTLGAVVNGADAVNAGTAIKIFAENDGIINGNIVTPGALNLVSGGLLTLSGPRDIVIGNPNSVAGTSIFTAPSAFVRSTAGNIAINAGSLTIKDRAQLRADIGTVTIDAIGNAIITGVFSGNATANAVNINSGTGYIIDGGDTNIDVTANKPGAVATITAQKGVGGVTLKPDGSIDLTALNPLEVDVDSAAAVAVTGNLNLTTQGFLNITSATAPGNIKLFGATGMLIGSAITTGGTITANAPTGPLTINQAIAPLAISMTAGTGSIVTQDVQSGVSVTMNAAHDITNTQTTAPSVSLNALGNLAAGALNVSTFAGLSGQNITGTINNQSPAGLNAAVTGPGGTQAQSVVLGINNPNSINFTGFAADSGQLDLTGPGALAMTNGILGTRLTVNTPLAHVVADTRNNGVENVDIKLYVPAGNLTFSLFERIMITDNFVLQRGQLFQTVGPGGTDVSIVDFIQSEVYKNLYAKVPAAGPALPPFQDITQSLVDFSGTPVSLDGLE